MYLQHAYFALDLAQERAREAELRNRYREELASGARTGFARRTVARAAAGVSRASASVARRLDAASFEAAGGDYAS